MGIRTEYLSKSSATHFVFSNNRFGETLVRLLLKVGRWYAVASLLLQKFLFHIIAEISFSYMTMPFRERHQREMKQGWCFRNRV